MRPAARDRCWWCAGHRPCRVQWSCENPTDQSCVAVLIDFGGGGFPSGEAAFSKALDDLAQPRQDRITLEVTGAATFGQPRVHTHPCGGRGRAIGPAGG